MRTKLIHDWSSVEFNTAIKKHEEEGWIVDRSTFRAVSEEGSIVYSVLIYKD